MKLSDAKSKVVAEFRLEALDMPVHAELLAEKWGVISIEHQPISSAGMLLPGRSGYKIILNESHSGSRQRFSLAHELGHLLLHKCGMSGSITSARFRGSDEGSQAEEQLCDQIAAEILMPRLTFEEDGWMEGWSVRNVRLLASKYNTSVTATARRMIDLMPDEALMGVWKVSGNNGESAKLQWAHAGKTAYRVPSGSVSSKRLALVTKAWNSGRVESGAAPVQDSRFEKIRLLNVPAEAMAWGRDEYKQVMVYYYPGREQESKVG